MAKAYTMVHGLIEACWRLKGCHEITIGRQNIIVRDSKKLKAVGVKAKGSYPVIVSGTEDGKALIRFQTTANGNTFIKFGKGLAQKQVKKGFKTYWNMILKTEEKGYILALDGKKGVGIFGLTAGQSALIIDAGNKSYYLTNDGKDVTCVDPQVALRTLAITADVSTMQDVF